MEHSHYALLGLIWSCLKYVAGCGLTGSCLCLSVILPYSLLNVHSLLLPQPKPQLTLNTPLSLSGPVCLFRAKQQCTQILPNTHLRRRTCAGVACQRPANTSRNRLSYCVLTVCRDGRQAEEKHSPHARMGYADHPTAGGACRG